MKTTPKVDPAIVALRETIDRHAGQFRDLAGAGDFAEYVTSKPDREDEEILTEPILAEILERVLGFPADAYYPQYGRSGLKPDLTPMDVIAHSYVLDAKASTQALDRHEAQIRA